MACCRPRCMIIVAPCRRWYDEWAASTMASGLALLTMSGILARRRRVLRATSAAARFGLYGVGLAIVLTVNERSVSLRAAGGDREAPGCRPGRQFGGAMVRECCIRSSTSARQLSPESTRQGCPRRASRAQRRLIAAENTGLDPSTFDSTLFPYLVIARQAAQFGYAVAFGVVAAIGVIGVLLALRLVRRVETPDAATQPALEEPR